MSDAMTDEFPIYPAVRQAVRHTARAGAIALLATPIVFFVLYPAATLTSLIDTWRLAPLLSLACGWAATAGIFLACLLAIWSHDVLLAHRGNTFTRMAAWLTGFLSLLWLASDIYTPLAGQPLLARQGELPLWTMGLLLANILFNLPNMAAAPLLWRLLLLLFPAAHLLAPLPALCLGNQAGLFASIGCSLAADLAAAALLLKLSRLAPLIVSMPPRHATDSA